MTTTQNDSNLLSWLQVWSLIIAFLLLLVAFPLGLSQPVGDLRTWCGIVSCASLFYLAGFFAGGVAR